MAARQAVWIEGGILLMDSDEFSPEERPAHRVAEFHRFVEATGWTTVAERPPDPADYPDADPSLLVPGSIVFRPPPDRVPLHDHSQSWTWVAGAWWHRPEGPVGSPPGAAR